jgi:hypothetical protein
MKTVLWAGNDPTIGVVLHPLFEMKRLRLLQATNGMDALDVLDSSAPDALVVEERFSHREWLLNLLGVDPERRGLPVVLFPEKARYRPPAPFSFRPPELIPIPIEGPAQWPSGSGPFQQDDPPDPGGNPNREEAARELVEFYVQLLTVLELADPPERRESQRARYRLMAKLSPWPAADDPLRRLRQRQP